MKQKTYRFRRFLAFVIDWNLAGLPIILLSALLVPMIERGLHPAVFLPIWLAFPVLFLNRDRLFKGRSPGNRLLKLAVLDRRTLQPLVGKALVTRNIFFLLGGLDVFVLLFSGSTLGDRAVAALVVPLNEIPDEPPRSISTAAKPLWKVVLIIVLFVLMLLGIVRLALNSVKDEPHYALAYSYLLESEAFAHLGAEPEDALLTGFCHSSTTRNGITETEAVFTFQVKGHQLVITCHPQGEDWYVCKECTAFQ